MKARSVSLARYRRDLEARGLRPNTVRAYVRTVAEFLQALGGPPSRAREKDVRNYVVALQQRRASSSVNVAIAAIACFYVETLRRPAVVARLRRVRVTHRLPTLLSGSEVMKLLEATRSAKYRAIFSLLYGAGLRLDEALHLRIEDIDSRRMVLRIPHTKSQPREVPMSERVLKALREYWREERPQGPLLFPGRGTGRPCHPSTGSFPLPSSSIVPSHHVDRTTRRFRQSQCGCHERVSVPEVVTKILDHRRRPPKASLMPPIK